MPTAQIVTLTEPTANYRDLLPVQMIKWDWLCTDLGVVSSQTLSKYSGLISKVNIIPDGGGTAPTTLYDITILDEGGRDILEGNGADCSATATEYLDQSDGLGNVSQSKLTLTIAAAGDAKGGIVELYLV